MTLTYIKLYHDFLDETDCLTESEVGRLLRAMLSYARGEKDTTALLTGNERYLFPRWQLQIDRDAHAYDQRCQTNRRNARLGGRARRPRPLPANNHPDAYPNVRPYVHPDAASHSYDAWPDTASRPYDVHPDAASRPYDDHPDAASRPTDSHFCPITPLFPDPAPCDPMLQPSDFPPQPSDVQPCAVPSPYLTPAPSDSQPGMTPLPYPNPEPKRILKPPTLEEVRDYCERNHLATDPERFFHHYEANDWTVAGRPLADWQAKLREWNAKDRSLPPSQPNPALNYAQRDYRDEDFDQSFFIDPTELYPPTKT